MAASRKPRSTDALAATALACLNRHVAQRDSLVVGLSGGVDSVVLLHAAKASHPSVAALHVHHGLSPDANAWEAFCEELCAAWSIPLRVVRVDVERQSADGLEAAARRARHEAYARQPEDWILLGHHRGDRAETLLFNLLRGAGVRGAGAMPERSGRLLRPLLDMGRSDILDYAKAHGLRWVDDHSNADTRFARNYLRHDVLPTVLRRFPAAEQRLASAAARFAEAADLLDELAVIDLGSHETSFPVDLELFERLAEPRARNVLRYLLVRQGVGIPSEERLAEALRQCLQAAPDRHPALTFGNWVIRRKAGKIVLEPI